MLYKISDLSDRIHLFPQFIHCPIELMGIDLSPYRIPQSLVDAYSLHQRRKLFQ